MADYSFIAQPDPTSPAPTFDGNKFVSMAATIRDMQQRSAAMSKQNALAKIFADPASVGPDGAPTAKAIMGAMQIDPDAGMSLLKTADQHAKSRMDRSMQVQAQIDPIRDAALMAHDDVLKKGGSLEQANAAGQKVMDEGIPELKQSGFLSDQEQAGLQRKFDYQVMRGRSLSYKEMLAQQDKQRTAAQEDERIANEKRRTDLEATKLDTAKEYEVTDPQGKKTTMLLQQNPRTGQFYTAEGHQAVSGVVGTSKEGRDAEKATRLASGLVTEETADRLADQYIAGDRSVFTNLGRGGQGAENVTTIQNAVTAKMKERGLKGMDLVNAQANLKADTSSLTGLTKMSDSSDAFNSTMEKNMSVADALMDKGAGTKAGPVINRWLQAGKKATGDSDVAAFDAAVKTVSSEYAKIMSGSTGNAGASVTAMNEADSLISKYDSPQAIRATFDVLRKDSGNRRSSYKEKLADIQSRIKGDDTTPAAVPSKAAAPTATGGRIRYDAQGNPVP
jgi:hypothetical protein